MVERARADNSRGRSHSGVRAGKEDVCEDAKRDMTCLCTGLRDLLGASCLCAACD